MSERTGDTRSTSPGALRGSLWEGRSRWLFWFGFFAFWTLIGILMATPRVVLEMPGRPAVGWDQALQGALRWTYSWALVMVAAAFLARRLPLSRDRWPKVLGIHLVAGALLLTLRFWGSAAIALWMGWTIRMPVERAFLVNLLPWDILTYIMVLAVGYALDYYRRARVQELTSSRLQLDTAALEARLVDAQLQSLKAQLQPHFLFATLEGISSRVRRDPDGAERMTAHLGDLLRAAISRGEQQEISLEKEVELLRPYLEIEKARRDRGLSVEIDVDPDVLDAWVPYLLLQPLVEGALERGAAWIAIGAEPEDGRLRLRVSDDGGPASVGREVADSGGFATLRARLERLYGPEQAIELRERSGGGSVAELSIPFQRLSERPPHTVIEGEPSVWDRGEAWTPDADADRRVAPLRESMPPGRLSADPPLHSPAREDPHARPARRVRPAIVWGGFFAFWTVLGILMAVPQVLLPRPGTDPQWLEVLRITLLDMYSWGGVALAAFAVARRLPFSTHGWVRIALLHLAAGIGILVVRFVAANGLAFGLGWISFEGFPPQMVGHLLPTNLVLYLLMAGAGYALAHHRRYQLRVEESLRLEARAAALETQLAGARLESLKMQLHPHFLFNTLNAISSLVREDPERARRMTTHLGDLLRSAISRGQQQEVTLREEVRHLEPYLEIERTRFGERLTLEVNIDPATLEARVPHLLLQPLVENAIKHGIAPRRGAGRVEIVTRKEGDRVRVSVRDDGLGIREGHDRRGGGVGLPNLRARLRCLYGSDHELRIGAREGGGVEVEISLPFRPEGGGREGTEGGRSEPVPATAAV